jgi:hypothetical protein
MLGKHPDEYPRFRDCFVSDEEHPEYQDHIHIYTRTGGGNRDDYEAENDEMRSMDGFVTDFDDSFDCTYASWVFKVPEQWQDDFNKIKNGKILEISTEYKEQLNKVYPKLKDKFNEIFNPSDQNEN